VELFVLIYTGHATKVPVLPPLKSLAFEWFIAVIAY
jgi:hypothetical protein